MTLRKTLGCISLLVAVTACGDRNDPTTFGPASFTPATEETTPFQSIGAACGSELVSFRVTDGIQHVSVINTGYEVSDNPYVDGWLTVWAKAVINTKTGNVIFNGSFELRPVAFPGSTWTASFGGHTNGGRFDESVMSQISSHMVAQGTGALEGMKLMFDHFPAVPAGIPVGSAPEGCAPGAGDFWKGVVVGQPNT